MPKCSGVGPAARNSHSATVSDNKVIIFGGSSPENGPMNDTFVLHTTGMIHSRMIGLRI